ncbi:MAG: hypothetical protein HUJ98_13080 [Bacteroidaceae bacterium]|nr:hypothetical protein [Bacteroidaceae bacterium]
MKNFAASMLSVFITQLITLAQAVPDRVDPIELQKLITEVVDGGGHEEADRD